ncbi:MAG: hypothetical protein IFNCLDLE_01386 [Ignavibacteriaceae bacterium]|nr:hypothetical protein [Ignavibacteriaceae bacterium]MBW7872493.1 hypothetical protein [Ignavibacteria bacterium]
MKRIVYTTMIFAFVATMATAEGNLREGGFNKYTTVSANSYNSANSFNYYGRFNSFYYNLRPYGNWIQINNVIVWKPYRVSRNWQPYSYGRWVYTSYGWFWDSDEPFGDIVFHYGRWYYDNWEGWVWVPGYEWAPAWVEWRFDRDYIGWAPLSPYALFDVSFGIRISYTYILPVYHWRIIRVRDFYRYDSYNYYFTGYGADRFYDRTNSFSNYKYRDRVINEGPDPREIAERGGGNIRTRDIEFTTAAERMNNKADGTVKIREIDVKGSSERSDIKVDIVRTRTDSDLKADKIDAAARETVREITRDTNPREVKSTDDLRNSNRDVVRNDPPAKSNERNTTREVKRDTPPTAKDKTNSSREVKREDPPAAKTNTTGSREVKREDPPAAKTNTTGSREVKREDPPAAKNNTNTTREVKREAPKTNQPVNRGTSGGTNSSGSSRSSGGRTR